MSDMFDAFEQADAAAAALEPAVRTVLDESAGAAERTAALAEPAAADLVALAQFAVEAAMMAGDHETSRTLPVRALAARPDEVRLALLGASVEANRGRFDPAALTAFVDRDLHPAMRRRLNANLGVALLAVGRVREGLAAWHGAAEEAAVLMVPDVAISTKGAGGALGWIERMRELLLFDGLGELAGIWGLGGPRMIVLLEGLAGATPDPAAADLLRAEATERLHRGRAEFTVDPAQDDVTLEELLLDAAAFAEQLGLAAVAARLR